MNTIHEEEEETLLGGPHLRRQQQKRPWDIFDDPPIAIPTGSMVETKWIDFGEKAGKVLAYLITFTIVLGGAVISKGSLMFMTSQLSDFNKTYCNEDLDRNKQFSVTLPEIEKIAWMWVLFFTYCVPQVGTFLRSIRMLLYKNWEIPKITQFLKVFVSESCSTIGNAILIFLILPKLDVVKGIMLTNGLCLVPSILNFLSREPLKQPQTGNNNNEQTSQKEEITRSGIDTTLRFGLDVFSIAIQSTVLFVWPLLESDEILWSIPVAVVLISFGWWENYVSINSSIVFIKSLTKNNTKFTNDRYFIYLFVSVWKCALFLLMMMLATLFRGDNANAIFDNFYEAFDTHTINITEKPAYEYMDNSIYEPVIDIGRGVQLESSYLTPIWVFFISVGSTYLCYIFGKFACKTFLHQFSYSFPINLAVPVSLTALIAMCGEYSDNPCAYSGTIPSYLFFNSPALYYLQDFIGQQHSWIWLLWLLSQAWITIHTWAPKCEKMARTERLYVRPMYEPFLIDQDIALNRRINDKPIRMKIDKRNVGNAITDEDDAADITNDMESEEYDEDTIPRIYACGTMWHENKEEMMEFLKSILRLDEDQNARRIVREMNYQTDYYEIETHIFFDDAFIRKYKDDQDPMINSWVKLLIEAVDDAATEVHQTKIKLLPPAKYKTPYGGRLEWILPGKTKMIAHLKDPKKIRKKKRWSQVMYMYYLLGYKLMARTDLADDRKILRATHTYLLALDGDIDFQPRAVHLLVDLMKKDVTLGAACGRIHPLGSGALVWYQMFEYAIGHWLQKATEHVIGCVLCSPGCFSLFRGEALMDDNVMRKYATKSSEALHYVQFDQGEDRWLCTLLLQRGYRVEYSAASDAYTHCPEGFNEFFNQRRRWMPSTTANIFDLLLTADRTIKANDNISQLYIVYQAALMIGTILGPGTIFLMLVGAFVAAFQMSQWQSFMWNLVPILIFMVTCAIFSNDKIQLFIAALISGVYSLVMMAVLVGVFLQINSDGIFAPSSLFFFCVAGEMIIAAMMHPKEFNCLKYGVVYYVTVPCMYMILVIYSVFNMNNVSWGTREVTVVPAATKEDANKKEKKEAPKKENNKILKFLGAGDDTAGGAEFSVGNLFRCLCCTLAQNTPLTMIMEKLNSLEKRLDLKEIQEKQEQEELNDDRDNQSTTSSDVTKVDLEDVESFGCSWLEDESLQRGEVAFISDDEETFWEGVLDEYLHPIDDTDTKDRINADLKNLRDKMVMAFFMVNAIFVLTVFLLTLKKDFIHINWPLEVKTNFTFLEDQNEIRIYKEYLQLEPIGILFLVAFAILLVVQFIAMLIHRLQTFSQIISNTSLNIIKQSVKNVDPDEMLSMNVLEFVKQIQKLKPNDDEANEINLPPGRRPTVHNLIHRRKGNIVPDLEQQFNENMESENLPGIPRTTLARLQHLRKTVYLPRKSGLPPGPDGPKLSGFPSGHSALPPRPSSMSTTTGRPSIRPPLVSTYDRPNSSPFTFENPAYEDDFAEFAV